MVYYLIGAVLTAAVLFWSIRQLIRCYRTDEAISSPGGAENGIAGPRYRERQYLWPTVLGAACPVITGTLGNLLRVWLIERLGLAGQTVILCQTDTASGWLYLSSFFLMGIPLTLLVLRRSALRQSGKRYGSDPGVIPRRVVWWFAVILWGLCLPTAWLTGNGFHAVTDRGIVQKPVFSLSARVYGAEEIAAVNAAPTDETGAFTVCTVTLSDGTVARFSYAAGTVDLPAEIGKLQENKE